MKIAVIGTGNVGGTLALKWADAGHKINLGVREVSAFEDRVILNNENIYLDSVSEAVKKSDVILLAVPAIAAVEVAKSLGDTSEKIIIDSMNIVMGKGPEGFKNTGEAALANTNSRDLVKCFNTTGFNNMKDTNYGGVEIDMFMAGDSEKAKKVASILSKDAGFAECYDCGGNDKFTLMESFANFWINLAMFRGIGRDIAFKILKR